MAINANELALLLRGGMAAKQADLLAQWIVETQAWMETVGEPDLSTLAATVETLVTDMGTAQRDITAAEGDIGALELSTAADHATLELILSGITSLAAKLDDDATVTDTDYEATLDAILNP